MPTGVAAGDNEVKQRRDFSEKHFPGWLLADSVWMGMMETQCGIAAVPMYVTLWGISESWYFSEN